MAVRILIVDDAKFMRHMLKKCLTQGGFEIAGEAENGAVGVQKFLSLKPDLVTLDMIMPEMGGLEAMRRMREMDPGAKIIIVSAVDQRETMLEAVRLGATDYIAKPFDAERVETAVNRALGLPVSSA